MCGRVWTSSEPKTCKIKAKTLWAIIHKKNTVLLFCKYTNRSIILHTEWISTQIKAIWEVEESDS